MAEIYNMNVRAVTGDVLAMVLAIKGPNSAYILLYQTFHVVISRKTLALLQDSNCFDPVIHNHDIQQNLWTKAMKYLDSVVCGMAEPIRFPYTWLLRVAYNEAYTHLRGYRNESSVELEEVVENPLNRVNAYGNDVPFDFGNPEKTLEQKEQHKKRVTLANEMFAMLSDDERLIVKMRLDDIPYKVIADYLGISAVNARTKHTRALRDLRLKNQQNGGEI